MRLSSFHLPRAYRLKPVGQREEDALSQLRIGTSNHNVLVPFSADLDYIVAPAGDAPLPIESADFRVETSRRGRVLVGAGAPHGLLQEEEIPEIR